MDDLDNFLTAYFKSDQFDSLCGWAEMTYGFEQRKFRAVMMITLADMVEFDSLLSKDACEKAKEIIRRMKK